MNRATEGNTVLFHYTGSLDDGTVFDSSVEREPLQVTIGQNEVIRGVDRALAGMAPGEDKKVTIPAEEAYGKHRPELVQEIERARIPPQVDVSPGNLLEGSDPNGKRMQLTVVEATDETVTLDANHPLAGRDLVFDLKLVEIV